MFKAVFKSNIKRYWWIFVLNMVLLILGFIVPILRDFHDGYTNHYWLSIYPMLLLTAAFGTLNGWSVFSYINSSKAVNLFHSLPSNRTSIFLANICFGGLATLIPDLLLAFAIPALTRGYTIVDESVNFSVIFINCAVIGLAFFAVACFTVMFSGNAVAGKVFTPIIIYLPFFLEIMFQTLRSEFLYGGTYGDSFFMNLFLRKYPCDCNEQGALYLTRSFWAYLIVAVAVLIGAYIAYRCRHMEDAGEIVTVSWAKVLFVQGAALCFGLVLTGITVNELDNFVAITLWGLVVAAAAMMILQKTYRIKGYIKQAIIYLCVVAAIFAGFKLDVTRYEKRVPKADKVSSVTIDDQYVHGGYYSYFSGGNTFTDPELIEKLIAAHKRIVKDKVDSSGGRITNVELTYNLKNGNTLPRSYTMNREALKTYFGEVMMTEAYKNRCFLLDTDWLNVASEGRQTYFTKEEMSRIRTALAADVAAADFDALYTDYSQDEAPFSRELIYVVTSYSENSGERGQWLEINSTLPGAYAAVREARIAHGENPEDTEDTEVIEINIPVGSLSSGTGYFYYEDGSLYFHDNRSGESSLVDPDVTIPDDAEVIYVYGE